MLDNLKLISAGAGSGKTYRLTQEMTSLLTSGAARPGGIIATTFTKRAAAELRERVRVKLLREGMSHEATELKNALIGTVHGLGVKLLRRFAFEAGVSPQVDIIADEDHQRLFNLSMAAVISLDTIEEIEGLCDRLGLSRDGEKYNWRRDVLRLVEIIRGNNFSAAVIAKSRRLSWDSLAAFLPDRKELSDQQLKSRLEIALSETAAALLNNEADGTKKTATAASYLRRLHGQLRRKGYLPWFEFAKLARFEREVGAKSRDLIDGVVELGLLHPTLGSFQDDLRAYQDLLFDCARDAISEYDAYKKARGRIDYTDMEVMVLDLLDHPSVRTTLQRELDLLMVDEFQDTSPIQLAVFLKLSTLAKQSVWVGDPKQSIYGFRGAEPRLMAAVMNANGPMDPANIQRHSWRSRADIVYACNAIFTKAFPEMPEQAVALSPVRTRSGSELAPAESPQLAARSGILHWHFALDGKGRQSKEWHKRVTAKAIGELLANPPLILPKGATTERPLRPGDIAVLCRTNFACVDMAAALAQQGLVAAIARTGLLETAEATLILACLKYLFNLGDTLSVAEILLFGDRQRLPDIIESRLDQLEAEDRQKATGGAVPPWAADNDFIRTLRDLRAETTEYSTSEMLNIILERLDLRRIIVAWGNGEQRLSNVDELRRLAVAYEDSCHRRHRAASLGGYLLYLDQLLRSGEDKQGAGERPEAVNVLTYHRSKGLEWPAVITMDLDQGLRAEVWGAAVVPETEAVDLRRPLADRWLKFWVNPYGRLKDGVPWLEALNQSKWKEIAESTAQAEEARLLYVGCTRARDYLIFPTAKAGAPWLDRAFARGGGAVPVLDPHTEQAPFDWAGHEVTKFTQVWTEPRQLPSAEIDYAAVPFLAGSRRGRQSFPPARVTEAWLLNHYGSEHPTDWTAYYRSAADRPADRLLAQAIAAFFAGDLPPLPPLLRLERAADLLANYLPEAEFSVEEMLRQSAAFRAWLTTLVAPPSSSPPNLFSPAPEVALGDGAQVQRKVPVQGSVSNTFLRYTVDYLLTGADGQTILVQNITQSGKGLERRLPVVVAELKMVAELLEAIDGRPVAAAYVHLPLTGMVGAVDLG